MIVILKGIINRAGGGMTIKAAFARLSAICGMSDLRKREIQAIIDG